MIYAVVCDIEGTTSSTRFVRDVLFPYAANNMTQYVNDHLYDRRVKMITCEVADIAGLAENDYLAILKQLKEWTDKDEKITPLKTLQGLIWEQGYKNGDYTAHLYPDAHEKLKTWNDEKMDLYVYSSGSVKAQQLFFNFSDFGDLSSFFDGYFDTTTGPKKDKASYLKIIEKIELAPEEILFLSDIPEELDAARASGMQTTWLTREADCSASEEDIKNSVHPACRSFSEIDLDNFS